jgi:D-alanyl-D-alanine endopeptidase (penicillin-binding protein 7)
MSPVIPGARVRRALALLAGLLALQLSTPSIAAERNASKYSARKAAAAKASAPAPRKAPVARAGKSAAPTGKAMIAAGRGESAKVKTGRAASARTAVLPPQKNGRLIKTSYAPRVIEQPRLSIGQAIGLHLVDDPLDLSSSVALVLDQQTGETLYQKNADAVLPIASITKVMTSMVVLDAGLPLDEMIEVTEADRDTERHSSSRLAIGARLSRAEMLHLALMASENRAAHALGRSYPGGLPAFVSAMNAKARAVGMADSRFADPTGLSSGNVSNARDLAVMVRAASGYPLIRQYSTATELTVDTGYRQVAFRSTNRLVDHRDWDIGMQKTGYISEAGKCLVMQARIDGRPTIIVLLDSAGTAGRFADAQRLRKWLEQHPAPVRAVAADTRS